MGTRIHANQNKSHAYSRLLSPLIAGSRGTLAPSHVLRTCEGVSDRAAALR